MLMSVYGISNAELEDEEWFRRGVEFENRQTQSRRSELFSLITVLKIDILTSSIQR